MKRSAFVKTMVVLGLATAVVAANGQPAGTAGPPPGYDHGPGILGGPGMMGGPGMVGGPGMMGGHGGEWGNGFGGGLQGLGLTTDQEEKIARIHEDTRQRNWDAMGQLLSEQFKLRVLYLADKPDANAIVEQQKKVDELRRVMIKSHVEMGNQIEAVLTKDQRELLRSNKAWRMH
jgi:Spy/CpxP family protein refolding chaperone